MERAFGILLILCLAALLHGELDEFPDTLKTDLRPKKIASQIQVLHHNITLEPPFPVEGDTADLNCAVRFNSNVSHGSINWYHGGFIIKGGSFSDSKRKVQEEHWGDGYEYGSHLRIQDLTWIYSDNITCTFKSGADGQDIMSSENVSLAVLGLPEVEISNLTVTLFQNEPLLLRCKVSVPETGHPGDKKAVTFTWLENGKPLVSNGAVNISIDPYESQIDVKDPKNGIGYVCVAENEAGEVTTTCVVIVITYGSDVCHEVWDHVDWPMTAAGTNARVNCPEGYVGYASKVCYQNGTWADPITFPCTQKMLNEIYNQITGIDEGLGADPGKTKEVADRLKISARRVLILTYESVIFRIPSDVQRIARQHLVIDDPPYDQEIQDSVETCSALADSKYQGVKKLYMAPVSDLYTDSFQIYSKEVAETFKTGPHVKEFIAKNIDLNIFYWLKSEGSLTYQGLNNSDTVLVPQEILARVSEAMGTEWLVVSIYNFKTANVIFSTLYEKAPISSVLTLGIVNMSYGQKLPKPIKLIFSRKEEADEDQAELCSFYSRSSSQWMYSKCDTLYIDEKEFHCECYETGSYAILLWDAKNLDLNLTINPSNISEGDTVHMECTVRKDPPTPAGTFTWTIKGDIARNGQRINIDTTYDPVKEISKSKLTLADSSWRDSGTVGCYFFFVKGTTKSDTAQLNVLAKPRNKIAPLSLTVEEGGHVTLSCSASVPGMNNPENSTFNWFRRNGDLEEDISNNPAKNETVLPSGGQMSNLTVQASSAGTVLYSCTATNGAGTSEKKQSVITVTEKGTQTCDAEIAENVDWPDTSENISAIMPCPGNATGEATRECKAAGIWDVPNFEMCIDYVYINILDEIDDVWSGIGNANKTKDITQVLEAAIGSEMDESMNKSMNAGNLNASLEAIHRLAETHQMFQDKPYHSEVQSTVQICSSLIDNNNFRAWKPILRDEERRATTIMQSIDGYSEAFSKSLEEITGFEASNIVLTIQPWYEPSGSLSFPRRFDNEGEWVHNTTDKVTLSNETLVEIAGDRDANTLVVSSAYYKTLKDLLPGNTSSIETIGSKVLAVAVANMSHGKLENPIHFTFETDSNVEERVNKICSYWNFSHGNGGSWDDSGCKTYISGSQETNCECYHMTNFAILVSTYEPPPHVSKALSIITYIGCSLSIIGMVTMMVIYCVLWKEVRSVVRGNTARQLTLMNLCGVLIIANVLFLTGAEQTETKDLCTAIAAILQYLFLVAFALMTVTSVTLYWKVSSFTRGMQADKTRNTVISLLLAWGVPMVIVAISLWVTGTIGYGNENYCWLSGAGIIWSFIGPVALMICVNMTILILVLCAKARSHIFAKKIEHSARPVTQAEILRSTFWSLLVLVPVMGVTWIFGFVAVNKETFFFQFIFAILNSFQGVFLLFFHCIFDASVNKAWNKKFGATPLERLRKTNKNQDNRISRTLGTSLTSMENLCDDSRTADNNFIPKGGSHG